MSKDEFERDILFCTLVNAAEADLADEIAKDFASVRMSAVEVMTEQPKMTAHEMGAKMALAMVQKPSKPSGYNETPDVEKASEGSRRRIPRHCSICPACDGLVGPEDDECLSCKVNQEDLNNRLQEMEVTLTLFDRVKAFVKSVEQLEPESINDLTYRILHLLLENSKTY